MPGEPEADDANCIRTNSLEVYNPSGDATLFNDDRGRGEQVLLEVLPTLGESYRATHMRRERQTSRWLA